MDTFPNYVYKRIDFICRLKQVLDGKLNRSYAGNTVVGTIRADNWKEYLTQPGVF